MYIDSPDRRKAREAEANNEAWNDLFLEICKAIKLDILVENLNNLLKKVWKA